MVVTSRTGKMIGRRAFRIKKQNPSKKQNGIPFAANPGNNKMLRQTFFIGDLPTLPKPSVELEEFLSKFQQERTGSMRQSTKSNAVSTNKANGFIAFRAYYSRRIANCSIQVYLSQQLAGFWRREKNQDVWRRYAKAYEFAGTKLQFVDWLQAELGIKDELPRKYSPNISPGITEDIFEKTDILTETHTQDTYLEAFLTNALSQTTPEKLGRGYDDLNNYFVSIN